MHLVQLLLPLADADGERLPDACYSATRDELAERFGGVTAYTRAPAHGSWQPAPGDAPVHDDVVIVEVMTADLDTAWWHGYRRTLERRFGQDEIVIRALPIRRL